MNTGALAFEPYRSGRGQEWMMRLGDPAHPPVLFVPPLLEELNRTRALIATTMRLLAAEGHGCWLPDLTGTSESLFALEEVRLADWRADVMAAADHVSAVSGRAPVVASIRGGCLIDDAAEASAWWRLAPATGARLVRELDRASVAGGADWAGYPASVELRLELAEAELAAVKPLRLVRLESDAAAADHKVAGAALWRRSEPANAPDLAAAIAADLFQWSRACAVS